MAAMMACRPPWGPRGGRDPPSFTLKCEEVRTGSVIGDRSTESRIQAHRVTMAALDPAADPDYEPALGPSGPHGWEDDLFAGIDA